MAVPWLAGGVEGFGQVPSTGVTSQSLGLYTWTGHNPGRLVCHLMEGCLPQPGKTSSFCPKLGPGLAYRASAQCSERAGPEAASKQQQQLQELPQELKKNQTRKAMGPIERTGGEMALRSPSQSKCFCDCREKEIATTNTPQSNNPVSQTFVLSLPW